MRIIKVQFLNLVKDKLSLERMISVLEQSIMSTHLEHWLNLSI